MIWLDIFGYLNFSDTWSSSQSFIEQLELEPETAAVLHL